MKITLISTSSRKNSNSLRFVNYLRHLLAEEGQHEVSIVSFEEYDIPLVGQESVKKDALTPFQHSLISSWDSADLVIFAMPEYNWTAPPTGYQCYSPTGWPCLQTPV
ncbi:NADPH-dependent FMN reductase [Spirosoma foliorum]|uniref:NADPH-dependent FMN reductase n=1 Tax=Spirosoma foliorum TaxID=2710596 RepID=UPI002868E357|nr:NAD(P)H-dependent oxidoreductase [Spirosoma foliorum]